MIASIIGNKESPKGSISMSRLGLAAVHAIQKKKRIIKSDTDITGLQSEFPG